MRGIPISAALFCAVLTPFCGAAAQDKRALPQNHDQALINAFEVMCNLELPNFDRLAARATAMRMQPAEVAPLAVPADMTLRRKAWNGQLTTGPFALLVDETTGAKGSITTCAIAGAAPGADGFRAEAMRELRLAPEPRPVLLGGHRAFIFSNYAGQGTGLVIEDLTPSGQAGVMIKLSSLKKAGP